MNDLYYGNHDAAYNACEVIATYNALCALNDGQSPVTFPELLNTFEETGIAAKGEFGTSPVALHLYLQSQGYESKMISGKQMSSHAITGIQDQYDTYILTAYNDANDLGQMIHTISITKENEGYVMHNAGDTTVYQSLEEAINGYNDGMGASISLIGVS